MAATDPYAVLGIAATASDAELRAAYRRAVQREHPDHNSGSAEAARRFEAVQEAYALIRVQRTRAAGPAAPESPPAARTQDSGASPGGADIDGRLAELERQLAEARGAREQARRAAREAEAAARRTRPGRATDEELGYVTTDDSFGQIFTDAADQLFSDVRRHDVPRRVSDLIDELGARLSGEPPQR